MIKVVLNIKTIKFNDNGFHYHKNIGLSIQRADATKTMKEIINQCNKNNINYYFIKNLALLSLTATRKAH